MFLFDDQEYTIPEPSPSLSYDVFYSDSPNPTSLQRLPNQAMSILKTRARKVEKAVVKGDRLKSKPKPKPAPSSSVRPPVAYKKVSSVDADIANLQQGLAQAAAEQQTTRLAEGPAVKERGGTYQLSAKPLPVQSSARSYSGSPAASGFGSPASQQGTDDIKQRRLPLIHEIAVGGKGFTDLLAKWDGSEPEFEQQLNKVAYFDDQKQEWSLNKLYWKDFDPYNYSFDSIEERQKAIDNAIRQFDRMRLGVSDPLWQKLLPQQDRGKGICLSKLQATLAKGPSSTSAPKINVQKPEISSPSAHSEQSDTASTSAKMAKGGEPMARSNSGTKAKKVSASEAQAKRLMSKPSAAAKSSAAKSTSAKASPKMAASASPKISPTKPTTKASAGKSGRVLSKEFITDSDSDGSGDEASSSSTVSKYKVEQKVQPGQKTKSAEKPKVTQRSRNSPAPTSKQTALKPKPASVRRPSPAAEKVRDSIRAEVSVKAKPTKRSREDEDDSSSSGAPLMKRMKSKDGIARASVGQSKEKQYRKSDSTPTSTQMSRTSSSGTSVSTQSVKRPAGKTPAGATVARTTSPVKPSRLASSSPIAASDVEKRQGEAVSKKRKHGPVEADERRQERSDSSDSSDSKRRKLSPEVLKKAQGFKAYYAKYEELHREIMSLDNPPEDKMADLLEMHERLAQLKKDIYKETAE
jgi:RNA polymerase II elongation factor ELL